MAPSVVLPTCERPCIHTPTQVTESFPRFVPPQFFYSSTENRLLHSVRCCNSRLTPSIFDKARLGGRYADTHWPPV